MATLKIELKMFDLISQHIWITVNAENKTLANQVFNHLDNIEQELLKKNKRLACFYLGKFYTYLNPDTAKKNKVKVKSETLQEARDLIAYFINEDWQTIKKELNI